MSVAEEYGFMEVRDTEVGKGLFATELIEHEEALGVVEGKVFDDPNYGSDYCIGLEGNLSLEPGEPFRFLNHSCEPNCELVYWEYEDTDERELMLHALRDIKAGEQLTIDYGWPASSAIQCKCGAASCRGWVVSECELEDVEEQ